MKKTNNTSGLLEITVDKEQGDTEEIFNTDEKVLLNSIQTDTSAIKNILNGKTDVEIKQLKATRKVIDNSNLNQAKNTKAIVRAIEKQSLISRNVKDVKVKDTRERLNPVKVIENKPIQSTNTTDLSGLVKEVHEINRNALNTPIKQKKTRPQVDNNTVKTIEESNKKIAKAINKHTEKIKVIDNTKLNEKLAKVKVVDSKRPEKNNKDKSIPKSWKKDKEGVFRDEKGRYVSKELLKKYNATDSRSFNDDEDEKETKRNHKILDSLEGIKDTLPNAENVDPMIDATKEVSDAVKTTFGFGKSILKGFGAVKGFFSKGSDNASDGESKSLGWFKKKDKKDKKHKKKQIDLLEEIADKRSGNSEDGGGILSFLFGGKLFKKFLAVAGGGFGLKALFGKSGKGKLGKVFKGGFKDLFKGGFKGLFKGGFKGGLKALFKGSSKRIPIIGSLLSFLDGGVGGGVGALVGGGLGTFFGPIGTVIGGIVGEQIGKWLGGLDWSKVGANITKAWDGAVQTFGKLWDGTVQAISDTWDLVTAPLKKGIEWISDTAGKIKETASKAYNDTVEVIKDGVTWASNTVDKGVEVVSGTYNKTKEVVAETYDGAVNSVKGWFGMDVKPNEKFNKSNKKITTFDNATTDAYLQSVVANESNGDHKAVNKNGYLGLYQMGAAALVDSGYIKPEAYRVAKAKYGSGISKGANAELHKAFLENPDNWTIKGGQQAFLNDKALQDSAMINYTNKNYKALKNKKLVSKKTATPNLVKALLVAHKEGVGGAEDYLRKGIDKKDGFGTTSSYYEKKGLATFNKLSSVKVANNHVSTISQQPRNISVNEDLSQSKKAVNNTTTNNKQVTNNTIREANKQSNNPMDLSQILTQDVSERRIAHIVNGGLSKPSQA